MPKFSLNTKVGEILKDPAATAVLESYIPNLSKQPQIKMAYGMTCKTMLGFPQSGLSKDQIAEIGQKLEALG